MKDGRFVSFLNPIKETIPAESGEVQLLWFPVVWRAASFGGDKID